MKNALINAKSGKVEIIEKNITPVRWGLYWHKKYETWKYDVYSDKNIFCCGSGIIPLPGGHRLIFSFRSPLWDGFYFSSMGGAGYQFKGSGFNNIAIIGKAEKPSLLVLDNGKVYLEELKENFRTVYEITNYVIENYEDKNLRAVVVGEASKRTNMGALFSQGLKNKKPIKGAEDWAARGGGGSVLYRAHNIAGIVFFGEIEEEDKEKIKKIVEDYYKKPLSKVILEHTSKYRYNKETNTGGTFGNNWLLYKEKVPIYNWRMPYISIEDRKKILEVILKNYLEIFNKEAIETKQWFNCGEPCPVLCKKYRNNNKMDYEPYAANGTLLGIFDLYEADRVVKEVDKLGFDAIEIGNVLAWLFELLDVGLLKEEELEVEKPIFDYNKLFEGDIKEISKHNADQAIKIVNYIAENKNEIYQIIALGKRKASIIFNQKFKDRIKDMKYNDYAAYVPFGSWGEIGPNLYWTPGFFMPLPIQGRYLTYYMPEFHEPEKLAELIYESIKLEMALDNLGVCRFHRRWLKPVLKDICKELLNIDDIEEDSLNLYKEITEFNKKIGYPIKIESERVRDLIIALAKEYNNEKWVKEFENNKEKVDEYIKTVLDKLSELLKIDWSYSLR
ncbi:aldehyde ferredoxin oxidoreductase [Methanocaldococcus villosus KIN24-T80]|uniref:Aldehyde ferredoxin oxidoreductase n=1 Tax=Methanocaldococcus villosus KIN24-T80 TaxID=1069083 RepID=N6V357_9EURY|nr:aldehyde ferredoxin oxidoreductase C-terminal domain-containing protein [Methanocaldococcus villosus]ENN96688.1 aldehyde ferredoxin oxidoreductase [Methanocaldococcus villosus KIN24-T80]